MEGREVDMLRLFDPSDPRMAGKHYLTDDDPQLQKSLEAYLTWKALASPKDGDLIPGEARLWYITQTRVARVAVDLTTGELLVHEYPDWKLIPSNEVEYVGFEEDKP